MIHTKQGRVLAQGVYDRDAQRIRQVEQSPEWKALVRVMEAKPKRAERLRLERASEVRS